MKKLIICLLGLTLLINHSFSQQPEKQWLIWNGLGKSNYSGGVNIYSNPITNTFTLEEIALPNVGTIPNAKNDFFIIYDDGKHLNSRSETAPGFFYNANDFNNNIKKHDFEKASLGGVKYLFLTNRYEGDDPPAAVKAKGGLLGSPTTKYPIDISTTDFISADHNVIYNRDITVIINYDSLRDFVTKEHPQTETFLLKFDGIQTIGNPSVAYGNNFLDPSKVFGSSLTNLSAVYPGPPSPSGAGEVISLTPGTAPYGYINFKKTSTAFPPWPNGEARYNAIFTLEKNGEFVGYWPEAIRASFDPNYLKVEAICQDDDGNYIVTYHLQFENTSTDQADALSVKIRFPAQFNLICVNNIKWHAAGFDCNGHLEGPVDDTTTFVFDGNNPIWHHPSDQAMAIGYIEFKVKVSTGNNLSDLNNSLTLNTPVVSFDNNPFPIVDFRDLVECMQEGSSALEKPQEVNRPQKTDKEDKAGKEEKPDDSTKQKKSAQVNDIGQMIMEPPPVGLPYTCFRPISSGTCACVPTICWTCVWAGIAVGLLAISFIVYRIMKRRNPRPPLGK